MKIVLVCGGRDYTDADRAFEVLDALHAKHTFTWVVHGNARGADTLGAMWADSRNIPSTPYPANWTKHGKAAGPIRNQLMLDSEAIDMVVSFPGGRGTADMVRRAKAKGIPVIDSETIQTSTTTAL